MASWQWSCENVDSNLWLDAAFETSTIRRSLLPTGGQSHGKQPASRQIVFLEQQDSEGGGAIPMPRIFIESHYLDLPCFCAIDAGFNRRLFCVLHEIGECVSQNDPTSRPCIVLFRDRVIADRFSVPRTSAIKAHLFGGKSSEVAVLEIAALELERLPVGGQSKSYILIVRPTLAERRQRQRASN